MIESLQEAFIESITQMITIILLTLIFPLYVTYIVWRNKWKPLHSISDSWYVLRDNYKGEENLFTLFCFLLGIGLVFLSDISSLFFFAGSGFCFVGVATQFKETSGLTDEVHYIGAGTGILCSFIGLFLNGIYIPFILFLLGTSIILWRKWSNPIFWIEIIAFLMIIYPLWIL